MNAVEKKVLNEAKIIDNHVIKVDSFLNHQLDVSLLHEIGHLFYDYFKDEKIDRIVTCEASGIGIAVMTAHYFDVPVVFAKKGVSLNQSTHVYQSEVYSYTKQTTTTFNIDKQFIQPNESVLIVDDFLANGEAIKGLMDIVAQANAKVSGVGIVIEKGFQPGGKQLREAQVNLFSLCIIDKLEDAVIQLRNQAVL